MENMKKITLLLGIFVLVCSTSYVNAQLQRRAFLGTQLKEVDSFTAVKHNMKHPKGVLVELVVDGSSAKAMGIEANDIVLAVEDVEVNSPSELVARIGRYRAGDKVRITTMRNGKPIQRVGKLLPLPYETTPFGEVIYNEIAFDGGYSRTIVHKPAGVGKFPAVFFIPGYDCSSIDRMHPDNVYKKLLDGLVEKGYVIVKTEKAGVGDSKNNRSCAQYNLFEEVELFSASFNALAKYDFIDLDNVYIFGHSMGGVQAPLLKTDFPPKGIAVYGSVIRPWFEYFIEHARMQKIILSQVDNMGWDYLSIEQQHETAVRFYYKLLIEKIPPAEIAKDEELNAFLSNNFRYDGSEIFLGRHYTFWQQLQDTKLFEAWSKSPAHVLSLWGEADFIAFNPWEHELIADVVNEYNPGKAKYIRIPNMDHSFLWVKDQEQSITSRMDWEYVKNNFNSQIIEILAEWIEETKK
jgi:uncharacterized protein